MTFSKMYVIPNSAFAMSNILIDMFIPADSEEMESVEVNPLDDIVSSIQVPYSVSDHRTKLKTKPYWITLKSAVFNSICIHYFG